MQRTGIYGKIRTVLITGVLTAALSVQTAAAAPAEETPVLTIEEISSSTGETVPGVELSVYRVAALDEKGIYTVLEEYTASGLKIGELENAEAQKKWAKTVSDYVVASGIAAGKSGVTDASGSVSLDGLEKGLYLVRITGTPGTDLKVEGNPFFVSLPMFENNGWVYHVTAQPKITTESGSNTPGGGGGNSGGGGGRPGRDPNRTATITDPDTPLASFPSEPELAEITDEEVPLAALPQLGDLGSFGYGVGMVFSLLGAAVFLVLLNKTGRSENRQ
ncbi:pilin N-terminal domain-containing protein [Clostridium transplantifaecale]|uniref:pilin N-terminal domain-containing protein n=1 Tax=Clostridium transplantifaecale TaxID=2479838 RepID=UPI000F64338C|nr:pilin N-terminal domain-containing protein [Clostridium transplantifaecale]